MVLSAIVDISDRKQKEARIEAALKEKDILLGEIHHRVKNNLQVVHSLLDLQAEKIDDEAIVEMLRESQNRVKSMALIHQMLYQSTDFSQVDFARFIRLLVTTLTSSYGMDADRIALSINAVAVYLPINLAIPCGLIVNELVSNALKYAFPRGNRGTITIDLSTDPARRVMLSVSDDGIGIPEKVDLDGGLTLGLQLVMLLTDQLGGELTIRRANPTRFGVAFEIKS
jgi:two-component sensor histidine kinase